jgi:hypothetical protein
MVCENADEHPALPPEHCTLAPHVKTGDAKRIDFSIERVAGRRQAKTALRRQNASSLAGNKMRPIVARKSG